jgi:hypothetical protein
MTEAPEVNLDELTEKGLLLRIAQELGHIRRGMSGVLGYIRDAEADIPEKYRRFVNAFHDIHDIKYMYEEHGSEVPEYILSEIRRMDDRYRQILKELNAEGGAFNKVRREMSKDPDNRYEHVKHLAPPKEQV